MATIRKKDLAKAVKESLATTEVAGNEAVNELLSEITKALINGDTVDLAGFGKFEVVEVAERQGINPLTKERITIPASKRIKFKAAKALKEQVK